MIRVLEPFEEQIKYMEHKDFSLSGGFKVKIFLNGNFKILDLIMVYQTSTTFSGMKKDNGTPLTPENCIIEFKEIFDFI